MRLVSYNIQYGYGRDGRYDLERAVMASAAADVIALQEVERNWWRTAMDDQPALIERLLPDRFWSFAPELDVDASLREPSGRVINRRRQHGQMVLSRWPILSSRMLILPKLEIGPVFNFVTGVLETVIAPPAGPLRIYNVHLGYAAAAERRLQVEALIEFMTRALSEGGVWSGKDSDAAHWQADESPPPMPSTAVLLGDFNAEPDAPEMQRLTGPEGTLIDAWRHLRGDAPAITYPADQSLDHMLVTTDLVPRLRDCWIDDLAPGSDHQPIWLEIA